jgi:hypothetical protein
MYVLRVWFTTFLLLYSRDVAAKFSEICHFFTPLSGGEERPPLLLIRKTDCSRNSQTLLIFQTLKVLKYLRCRDFLRKAYPVYRLPRISRYPVVNRWFYMYVCLVPRSARCAHTQSEYHIIWYTGTIVLAYTLVEYIII